ncbi:MAG: hypothetical protein KF680_00925 [Cryobacterium sp.]|nr:hypothetical protein [Cryobacterium sp.]
MTRRIRVPAPPQPPEKPPFPLLASLAPVAGALVMWAFTQSPFALVFALLGPLVAGGGLVDSRRRRTKQARLAREQYAASLRAARQRIDAAHESERAELLRAVAPALDPLTHGTVTHERWRHEPGGPLTVSLGIGSVASELSIEGSAELDAGVGEEQSDLAMRAAQLDDAPILVDARAGIGIVGPALATRALLRAIVVQLAHSLAPDAARLHPKNLTDVSDLTWLLELPHASTDTMAATAPGESSHSVAPTVTTVHFTDLDGHSLALVALAAHERDLPRECHTIVSVSGVLAVVVRSPVEGSFATLLRPHMLSLESATQLAVRLRRRAVADGLTRRDSIPERVAFADLGEQPSPAQPTSLDCVFALGSASEPIMVDLVGDGPHALVGGTTGSGKSELLCAWVLAMAANRTPRDLNVLLVDFKGGASFRIIESLPHCVGTVTDLDPTEAERALTSLRAELRYRERVLAEHGARDVAEIERGALARLVIVVDEYAALVIEHPSLHAVFADIAARGRSLGVHLILSTQRPAGVVRDAVFANAPIRVSLRVLDSAESTAVIGVADAARLSPEHPGRALVSLAGSAPVELQPALVTAQDVAAIRSAAAQTPGDAGYAPRRPWLPSLPLSVTPSELAESEGEATGIRFALADRPFEQRRVAATYDPRVHGHLLVIGAKGSGRSTVLAALAASAADSGLAVTAVPSDIEGAWDVAHEVLEVVRSGNGAPQLCLIDDLDVVVSRLPDDYRDLFLGTVGILLHEGPFAGVHLVITTARVGSAISAVAALCESRLVLRMPDRHEHHVAGADPARFTAELPPGRGWWRDDLVQVAQVESSTPMPTRAAAGLEPLERRSMLVVSSRATELAATLDAAWGSGTVELLGFREPSSLTIGDPGEPTRVLIADPETWQGRWAQFTELGRHVPVAFHECTPGQYRQLCGSRALPAPLARPGDSVWLLHPGGRVTRARLPARGPDRPR